MTSRCIIVSLQRAGADDSLEHLVDGASEKLTEIRRKLARWAKDLTDLPMVDRPPALSNQVRRQLVHGSPDRQACRRGLVWARFCRGG